MSCDFCKDLPIRVVRQLNTDIADGTLSIVEIAKQYSVDPSVLELHTSVCIKSSRPSYTLLEEMLRSINQTAAARLAVHTETPMNSEAMEHYIALVREARSTIVAMEKIKPSSEMTSAIIQQVLKPLMNSYLSIEVEECNKLRLDLNSFVDSNLYIKIDSAIKQMLRRVASRQQQVKGDIVPRLQRILSDETASVANAVDDFSAEQVDEGVVK